MEHSFDIEFAKEYGLVAAFLYRHMQFWIAKNKANGKNYKDAHTWTYNSVKAFNELFSYLGPGQIRAALKQLVNRGILLKNNYNKRNGDCTSWYAFVDETTAMKGLPTHLLKSQRGVDKKSNPQAPDKASDPFAKITKPSPKQQILCENSNALPDRSNPNTPTQINNNIEKRPQEILELDCRIAEAKKFLREQLSRIFPPFSKREIGTFNNILKYFVNSAQADPRKISWFKDAVEWARIARLEGTKAGGKALFVQIVKERTGYGNNPKLLSDKSSKDSRARASPAA